RLYVVGSNTTTSDIIEGSYKNILKLMDKHMNNYPYIFGERPSSSDFALYGQLTQLTAFDPTPMKIADNIASRIVAWVGIMEDLSGLEVNDSDWVNAHNLTESFRNIFYEIGNTYVPVLKANYEAVYQNKEEVKIEIKGKLWTQKPFSYQAKCLNWIKEEYGALENKDKNFIDEFLNETGCEQLLNEK
ncbi:MAG: glutathione S-transferase, partial [Pelagibacterales bacterium]|nr:glutathione S-transferase [Pelagibacterales bacterium]